MREQQSHSNQPADAISAKVAALLEKASALHAAGRLAEAERLCREALEASPNHPDALHFLGVIALQAGLPQFALQLIDGAIQVRPEFGEAHLSRGSALCALKRYQEALDSIDTTLQLDPFYAEAHSNRGVALGALKRYEEALECFEKALQLKPGYDEARYYRDATLREFALQQAALTPPMKKESSGRDLVFYCGPTVEVWNPQTAREKGIGGSEEAVIWLSRLLHERGWNVVVYCNCGKEEAVYDGVSWKPFWQWNQRNRQDVTVIWREPVYLDAEINSGKVILDMHDTRDETDFTPERLQKLHKIFVKSTFHRSLYPNIPDEKFAIVPNGIDTTLFGDSENREPSLLINTSSADRSLEAFLDCFEEIKKQVPDAKAEWAYGWDVWDIVPYEKARKAVWKADMVARIKELGVKELGRISHGEIAELYRRASIFVYPTEFAEIDCISLSKGMAAGAIPITTDFAAMGNKSHHGGVFLHSKKTKDNWYTPEKLHYGVIDPELKAQFVREAVKLLRNPPTGQEREPMREWARHAFDWHTVADSWNEVLVSSPAVEELLQRGRAHHIAGQLIEAQALYREILLASPDHADALHLLGVIASQMGQYGLGIELIDMAIQGKRDFADAYFSRGNAQYALQQFHAAVESYDKAIELKPQFAEACFSRGNALHALKQYGAAVESYDKAIQLNPEYAEAYQHRSWSLEAQPPYQAALESSD